MSPEVPRIPDAIDAIHRQSNAPRTLSTGVMGVDVVLNVVHVLDTADSIALAAGAVLLSVGGSLRERKWRTATAETPGIKLAPVVDPEVDAMSGVSPAESAE